MATGQPESPRNSPERSVEEARTGRPGRRQHVCSPRDSASQEPAATPDSPPHSSTRARGVRVQRPSALRRRVSPRSASVCSETCRRVNSSRAFTSDGHRVSPEKKRGTRRPRKATRLDFPLGTTFSRSGLSSPPASSLGASVTSSCSWDRRCETSVFRGRSLGRPGGAGLWASPGACTALAGSAPLCVPRLGPTAQSGDDPSLRSRAPERRPRSDCVQTDRPWELTSENSSSASPRPSAHPR
ncbi:TPA: hypothetical protein BOS_12703 [Bos taurus]|nr:TPA: hypothetical protein BOS_12703 [Bos taurus]